MNDLLYQIALTKIPLVGAVTAKNLISYSGGAEAVFRASKKALLKIPGIGEQTAQFILNQNVLVEAEKELEFIEQHEIRALSYLDKDYPQRLKHYHDAPLVLFFKGTTCLNASRTVAIVGTRKPSNYGVAIAEELVAELAPWRPVIVSGLAYGIDITAHRAALRAGLETIGVMGHGFKMIYPAQHKPTAMEMLRQGGLLTEFTHKVNPDRENFPMRNRIVAGLCDALIVVETAKRGGSMITARIAESYNKTIFAVPGRANDRLSQGCNDLIKSGKAHLIDCAGDLVRMLNWEVDENQLSKTQPELFIPLSEPEKAILDFLQKEVEVGIDRLTLTTKVDHASMASLLLEMEFKGLIRAIPGKRYVLA